MSEKPSRRTVLRGGLVAAVGAAIPPAMAKEVSIDDLSKGLAHPLSPETHKLAEAALKDVNSASEKRLKHPIAENSEPAFVYSVRPGATTKW